MAEGRQRETAHQTPNSGENGCNSEKGRNRVPAESSQGNNTEKTTMWEDRNQWRYKRSHGDTPAPNGHSSQE